MGNRDIELVMGAIYIIVVWVIALISDWPFYKMVYVALVGAAIIAPIVSMVDYTPAFVVIDEIIRAVSEKCKTEKIALIILIISQLIFLAIISTAFKIALIGALDLGRVPSVRLETRTWGMLISICLFFIITFPSTIEAWFLYSKKSYGKAIFLSVLPSINLISFYLWAADDLF